MVAPATRAGAVAPVRQEALLSAPGAGQRKPAIGVRVYAVPTPSGDALVAPDSVLADLRDAGYLLADYPTGVRVDLLCATAVPGAVPEDAVVTLLRHGAAAAGVMADPGGRRLAAVGPRGAWYATVLVWAWLLLLFAAQNVVQVAGGLWLVAGLPLARRAHRRRVVGWERRGVAGLAAFAGPVEVRCVSHAGLALIAGVIDSMPGAPAAACRAAARACVGAGLAELSSFYDRLGTGEAPARVWLPLAPRPATSMPHSMSAPSDPLPQPSPVPEGDGLAEQQALVPEAPTLESPVPDSPLPEVPEGGALRTSSTPT